MDTIVAGLIEKVTALQIAVGECNARLSRMERQQADAADQETVDKEQASRREMAELRKKLQEAEAKAGSES